MQGLSGFFKAFVNKSAEITPHRNDNLKALHTEENNFDTSKGNNSVAKCETMNEDPDLVLIRETVYDLIKDIRDPEKPQTLEELNVVSEDNISVQHFDKDTLLVNITFVPTVPHCSLASLIGLCLRQKLTTCLPDKHKLDIFVKEGSHETADDINKQINDKERIAAAMENPNLRDLVNQCVSDEGG